MIILLFAPEKRAYIGFIPVEQTAFVMKMKQILSQSRSNMELIAMNKSNVSFWVFVYIHKEGVWVGKNWF